jgi:hypothetical protein
MRSIFISYRHESPAHAATVRQCAERLRTKRLPVEFDQFYLEAHPAGPDEGWPKWCRDRAVKAECVLVIASPGWFRSYESEGDTAEGLGAAEEARIFSQAIYRDKGFNHRIRFVILNDLQNVEFPLGLDAWHKFDLVARPDDLRLIEAWACQKLSIAEARSPRRLVYVAECLIESDGLREGLIKELETHGWQVVPNPSAPTHNDINYATKAADEMRRAVAFVQLLQPDRWRFVDHDYLQHEQALQIGIPRIRFRSPDLDLSKISDKEHLQFLTSDPCVIARPFDQFKKELLERLDELWDRLHENPSPESRIATRLVRVVDRSSNADTHWVQVFPWLNAEPGIIHDRVRVSEVKRGLLTVKQRTKPCQGFLIVCDSSALTDPLLSPDESLDECQEIQLRSADDTHCPPVGIVYWPPPPDNEAWPKLLSFKPLKLHTVLGGNHATAFAEFFKDVRQVVV